jgi:hypothetical protein
MNDHDAEHTIRLTSLRPVRFLVCADDERQSYAVSLSQGVWACDECEEGEPCRHVRAARSLLDSVVNSCEADTARRGRMIVEAGKVENWLVEVGR